MSAVIRPAPPPDDTRLSTMSVGDLAEVSAIEALAYEFPWTRGNFIDSLAAGYLARLLRSVDGTLLGYFVAMKGVDEMHLLNLTVAPAHQRRGHARRLLDALVAMCRAHDADRLWLEVRQSNDRARALYLHYGFRHIGVRRGYYPALHGKREDASVMSLDIGGRDAVD
jgi:[ribosomal protein S18]-alanine N-acetyltransferase